jgi:hypothetical protein
MKEEKIIKLRLECINNAIRIAPNYIQENEPVGSLVGSFAGSKDVDKVVEIAEKLYNWINE